MSAREEGIDLEVQFSGLALYVLHPDGQRVAVLMPDCRRRAHPTHFHPDETDAEAHAGYVRFDLENVSLGGAPLRLPPVHAAGLGPGAGAPRYELVHRFDRQVLHLDGLAAGPIDTSELRFPEFERIAERVELVDGLFSSAPPPILLMRTVLTGGVLRSSGPTDQWRIPPLLSHEEPYVGTFSSTATWTTRVPGDHLKVRVSGFDGAPETELELRPADGGPVRIKLANLCAHNPLEWEDLDPQTAGAEDADFRWLYRLVRLDPARTPAPRAMDLAGPARAPRPVLPVPRRGGSETAAQGCMGATTNQPFPPEAQPEAQPEGRPAQPSSVTEVESAPPPERQPAQ
ncbi:MAG TPA: hypothetical protein VFQ45_01415, partial [Longimicrobium sp.]|nr:hypothetical protein [Longimicrobium sp.]